MSGDAEGFRLSKTHIVSELVAAYVTHNHVASADLPAVIASVHAAIARLSSPAPVADPPVEAVALPTATQVRKSVQHDGIVSFLDGKSYKTLKRHLATYGLNPRTYRERFGLHDDYPMVAAAYSERRSKLAKDIGLGMRGAAAQVAAKKRRRAA
jgi:predicted transcriptional regulator